MRGKHVSCFTMRDCLRIIPARAGQTYVVMNTTGVDPDHPRACGANADNGQTVATRNGSSPRVRGKLARSAQVGHGVRIIPARAGQTHARHAPARTSPDHPRACGANSGVFTLSADISGSSPRVRGKLKQRFRIWKRGSDHPRACGANPSAGRCSRSRCGSSPRVRGKPAMRAVA